MKRYYKFLERNLLLISGLFLISIFGIYRYHQVRILTFYTEESYTQEKNLDFTPTHIKAYPVGVEVDILPATIKDGVWPVFANAAGYVTNGNNLIIYGHNKNEVMGPIRWIKEGAEITLIDQSGNQHKYEVIKTDIVEPDNLSYIQKSDQKILTVYTCIGFLDSKRFVVVAKPSPEDQDL